MAQKRILLLEHIISLVMAYYWMVYESKQNSEECIGRNGEIDRSVLLIILIKLEHVKLKNEFF